MENKKLEICPVCEIGELVFSDNIISEINGFVFIEKGKICTFCNEEFISEKEAQRTIEVSKKLGIWPEPLKLYRKLSRSGKNLTLRIPQDLEKQMNLKSDTEVAISKIGNRIIIEPIDVTAKNLELSNDNLGKIEKKLGKILDTSGEI